MNTFIIKFTCDVCGTETGDSVTLFKDVWNPTTTEEEYRTKQGIVDHRHTTCEKTQGSFKEMAVEYQLKTGSSVQEAEDFVKQNRKRVDFDKALRKVVKILMV